jgi:predicted TIM-barrel fold metal-dependent hydrolase
VTLAAGIIDMRLRPSFLHRFFGSTPGTPEFDLVCWVNKRVGSTDVEHFSRYVDVAAVLAGMDEAGIAVGVMVGRSTPTVRIANETLRDVAAESGGRLVGVASVDPVALGREAAVAGAVRAVRELGLAGINLDAGFYERALRADDDLLLPLYEACVTLGVPAFVMSGPTTPDLAFNDPLAVDRVARMFPSLPIVCCHGFYPNIDAMVGVAFRNENVYVSPDMYLFAPGGRRYAEAATGFLQDQILFGSSFPFRPMRQSVDDLAAFGLSQQVRDKLLRRNACKVLGLDAAAG